LLFIWLVARASFPIERDVKHFSHAAHAFDPSVLEVCSVSQFCNSVQDASPAPNAN
jgi:hypothetical protein